MDSKLYQYILIFADDALIMGHRLSEWTGHGPALEQDIAISNIALDYIGQARNFYQYAASVAGDGRTEDDLAYLRDVVDFKNHLLVELPNGDWAQTLVKIFYFSNYQVHCYRQLIQAPDQQLSGIAEKSLKEALYHLRWSAEWIIRLGDGTEESRKRLLKGLGFCTPYAGELYTTHAYDMGFVNYDALKEQFIQKIHHVFEQATLAFHYDENTWMQKGGPDGRHTEHLGFLLAEMQFLQRAYPGAQW